MTRQARAKEVNNLCRAVRRCPSCDSVNGVVKKSGPLKISHEPFRNWKGEEELDEYKRGFQGILRDQPELGPYVGKPIIDVTAQMSLELFNGMSDEVSKGHEQRQLTPFTFETDLYGCCRMLNCSAWTPRSQDRKTISGSTSRYLPPVFDLRSSKKTRRTKTISL